MERLNDLQRQYEEIKKNLIWPFSIEEFVQLRDRRKAICLEARTVAEKLHLPGLFWFNE